MPLVKKILAISVGGKVWLGDDKSVRGHTRWSMDNFDLFRATDPSHTTQRNTDRERERERESYMVLISIVSSEHHWKLEPFKALFMMTTADRSDIFFSDRTCTECPKIYRKSVLHLLKYTTNFTKADAVQICGKFWDTQYHFQRGLGS